MPQLMEAFGKLMRFSRNASSFSGYTTNGKHCFPPNGDNKGARVKMRLSRAVMVSALVVLVAIISAFQVRADSGIVNVETPRMVNLELKDVTVKDAIDELFKDTGYRYQVQPDVSGKVVELKLKGITFDEALSTFADAAGLVYRVEDGVYTISKAKTTTETTRTEAARSPEPVQTASQPAAGAGPTVQSKQSAPVQVQQPDVEQMQQYQPQGHPNTQVIVNPPPTPVYYGHPDPYGYHGYYPPAGYSIGGSVRIISGNVPVVVVGPPSVLMRTQIPPPPGWVSPDQLRFIRGQYSIMPRYIYSPGYWW